jgi:hypothetical protein
MSEERIPATPMIDRAAEKAAETARKVERTVDTAAAAARPDVEETTQSLFEDQELSGFRSRWEAVQTGFVDEPRAAVSEADALVKQVVSRLSDVFTQERARLEGQWDRGGDLSTEDLRQALRRYRAFFDRLLRV